MRRLLLAAICFLVAAPLRAALDCYAEMCIPSVARFERTPDGLIGILSGKWAGARPARTIVFDGTAWRQGPPIDKPLADRSMHCPDSFKGKDYARTHDQEEAKGTQAVCAESGNFVYGGIQYYAGEGMSGTGGLIRYDRRNRAVEIRRLTILRDVSVNSIAADGDTVWFGTTTYGECTGEPFVHGLVRYDWSTGSIATYEGTDDGPLGFTTYDLTVDRDSLWIATDLGVSRLDRPTNVWHHYVPEEKNGRMVAPERKADDALSELLRTIPADCLMSESFDNQLVRGLALFRPRFLRAYLQSRPASEWKCAELEFLASRMPDYATLKRRLLSVRPPESGDFACVVEGFTTKKHVEREWRDLLVSRWKETLPRPFSPDAFRYFRGDDELARMLAKSSYDRAVAVVPLIAGEKAIPLLTARIALPDAFSKDNSLTTAAAIYGLELAAHRRVSPDGKVEPLPAGSDQPWYAEHASLQNFFERRWFKWNDSQRSAVVAAWLEWVKKPEASRVEAAARPGGCWVWPASVSPERRSKPFFESNGRDATLRFEAKVTALRLADNFDESWWASDRLEARYTSREISVHVKLIADPCPPGLPEGACENTTVHGTLTIQRKDGKQQLKVSGGCGT